MIRDLAEMSVELVRREKAKEVRPRAEQNAEERLLTLLLPTPPTRPAPERGADDTGPEDRASHLRTREKLRAKLRAGELEESVLELDVKDGGGSPMFRIWTGQGMEEMNVNLKDSLPGLFGGGSRRRRMTVAEAREQILGEEEEKLINPDQSAARGCSGICSRSSRGRSSTPSTAASARIISCSSRPAPSM